MYSKIKKITQLLPWLLVVFVFGCGSEDTSSEGVVPPGEMVLQVSAGKNLTVYSGQEITLVGQVADSDGTLVKYSWQQVTGPSVSIQDNTTSSVQVTVPDVSEDSVITFELIVTDNNGVSATSTVEIKVLVKKYIQVKVPSQYFDNSIVCIDLDDNGICETEEESRSNVDGIFQLDLPLEKTTYTLLLIEEQNIVDANKPQYPLKKVIHVVENENINSNITILSTLVATYHKESNDSDSTISVIEQEVAASLKIDTQALNSLPSENIYSLKNELFAFSAIQFIKILTGKNSFTSEELIEIYRSVLIDILMSDTVDLNQLSSNTKSLVNQIDGNKLSYANDLFNVIKSELNNEVEIDSYTFHKETITHYLSRWSDETFFEFSLFNKNIINAYEYCVLTKCTPNSIIPEFTLLSAEDTNFQQLSWTKQTGATGYRVYVYNDINGEGGLNQIYDIKSSNLKIELSNEDLSYAVAVISNGIVMDKSELFTVSSSENTIIGECAL